jgi:TPR repeat protein
LGDYEKFANQAKRGNGEAAFALYQLLSACTHAYTDPQDLEAAIDKMYQTRTFPIGPASNASQNTPFDGGVNLEMFEIAIRGQAKSCSEMTVKQLESTEKWLFMAADLGHDSALIDYAASQMYETVDGDLQANYQMTSVEFLERAWLQGNVRSLLHLWEIYGNGSPHIDADSTKAYAYIWLQTHLRIAQYRSDSRRAPEEREELVAMKLEFLQHQTSKMRLSELNRALQLAEEILRANNDCCFDRG